VDGPTQLIREHWGIRLVAETGSGLVVAPLVDETKPDVLILEMELPGISGVTITQQMQALNAPVRVLGFSIHDDARYIFGLLRSGGAGYLTKVANERALR
jgi:DNA-binding NarL/FixJ family response regulator